MTVAPATIQGCTLRRAEPADAAAVAALVDRAYAKYVARMGRMPLALLTNWDHALRRHEVWVVEDGADPVAMIELIPGGALVVEAVAVEPARQGRGLGRFLLALAERRAAALGMPKLRLSVNETMVETLRLYAALGYRETGRRAHAGTDIIFMAKTVAAP